MQDYKGKIIQATGLLGMKIKEGQKAFPKLAKKIHMALTEYPYYCIVRGYNGEKDTETVKALLRAAANDEVGQSPTVAGYQQKVSFTRVRINYSAKKTDTKWTSYSRTNQALGLHTDSSYNTIPHQLIAFHMHDTADDGGDSLLTPVDDILKILPPNKRKMLETNAYPFSERAFPILSTKRGVPAIRFYRHQIERTLEQTNVPKNEKQALLETITDFETFAEHPDICSHFTLQEGELLIINNWRVLHGRTAFAADSKRLMFRYRVHSPLAF